MATDEDESRASVLDDSSDMGTNSASDVDGDSDTEAPKQVEWLATTRAKRSTAGNRMKAMLANVEPAAEDSDLELLFAEDEDDVGFTDDAKDDGSDVHMDSSSDDEDQDEAADDLTGEKELERQAREKRNAQRKRKAQEAIPARFRKKVRIEQSGAGAGAGAVDSASPSSTAPPPPPSHQPRPKKKSERVSWLPTAADLPTRASERSTTRISKQQLHQKMVTDEIKRKKQLERMEKNAKRLEALKKPPMTQAERLQEAALVEKRNSKSLNRWEVAEKTREEERLRKIAALHSRKLDGPVVTFWSGIQELEEGQLKHVGKMVSIEEKAPRKKRQSTAAALIAKGPDNKAADEASKPPSPTETSAKEKEGTKPVDAATEVPEIKQEATEHPASSLLSTPALQTPVQPILPPANPAIRPPEQQPLQQPPVASILGPMAPPPIPPPPPPSEAKHTTSAVLAAPVLAPPAGVTPSMLGSQMPMLGFPASQGKSNVLAPPNTSQGASPLSLSPPASAPAPVAHTPVPTQGKASSKGPDTPKEASAQPGLEGKVTRSCIILQNFDENAIKDRQVQTQILFGRKMNKLAKPAHPPLCVITNHPARHRDPKTGLPFYNSYAFKEIQRVCRGDYKFSRLLGAYVGSGNYAARGVPERFLDPTKERTKYPPTEATLVPKDGVVELKDGEGGVKEGEKTADQAEPKLEPKLEPVEEPQPAAAAPGLGVTTAGNSSNTDVLMTTTTTAITPKLAQVAK
ncbi:YL1 nuclear protein-domain-containing protein [Bombardia bombarda]|uniref:YL1 nuclear protein-domain-containing protein n=1 Tax=Bombardia bombarda TaxID=252184 RepID=A0AA39WT65_9PEZI|nr:YL1 nuclear protein-domain-containing protein [Bombardia bombarda]